MSIFIRTLGQFFFLVYIELFVRERKRDRQRERETERETDRERETEREERERETDRERESLWAFGAKMTSYVMCPLGRERERDLSRTYFKHSMPLFRSIRMDGWMTCDFTSFLAVFQTYQDDVWMIMKGCVQWNSVYG